MAEPWEIRTNDERTLDTDTTFLIFFEDDVCEPLYFKTFEVAGKVKINDITNQLQNNDQLLNALTHCVEQGLMQFKAGIYQLPEDITENIWCVFDRDVKSPDPGEVRLKDNVDFNSAISQAKGYGFQVAWSNDIFELWLLLHFEDVPIGQPLHRTYVYERLTAILKAWPGQSPELAAITGKDAFYYKGWMKKRVRFGPYVLPLLKGRTQQALARAEGLAAQFNDNIPYHERNPCTMVFALVRELLAAQE
jgi:hypothetical protein